MRKVALVLTASMIFSAVAAQDKTHNLGLGVSPWGMQELGIQYKSKTENERMKINYVNYLAAHLAYETQNKGRGTLLEFSYAQSELKNIDKDIINKYQPDLKYDEKITTYSFHIYGIVTINKQKRLQIPLYFGIGGDYIEGGPVNAIFGMASGKARLKLYLTNKIGLYGGYSYDIGLTYKNIGDGSGPAPKVDRFMNNYVQHIDAGITFSL